ncbi:MAG: hypothetical protein JJU13_10285 [Balneolaceae bacterium]|nr:hypothetical protein [Balneolaceae bacterium]
MNRKIVIDPTPSQLLDAARKILMDDEFEGIQKKLNRIERDRVICDLAAELRRSHGLTGKDLEQTTLKLLNAGENFYTEKTTIHTVKTALYKTEYGRSVKKYTKKQPRK